MWVEWLRALLWQFIPEWEWETHLCGSVSSCTLVDVCTFLCFYSFLCLCMHAHAEDSSQESSLSFDHVSSGDQIQVIRLNSWCLGPLATSRTSCVGISLGHTLGVGLLGHSMYTSTCVQSLDTQCPGLCGLCGLCGQCRFGIPPSCSALLLSNLRLLVRCQLIPKILKNTSQLKHADLGSEQQAKQL